MSSTDAVVWAVAVEALLLVTLAGATVAARALRGTRRRRNARLVRSLRHLVASIDFDAPDAGHLHRLRRLDQRRWRIVEPMIVSRIGVRRTSHATLRALLVERGTIAAASQRVRRPGAVGRARAAHLLARVQCDSASAALTMLLDDRDPAVRAVAVRGLARVGDAAAARALMARVASRRPLPDQLVLHALVSIGPAAAPSLVDGLSGTSEKAFTLAMDALRRLHASRTPSARTTTTRAESTQHARPTAPPWSVVSMPSEPATALAASIDPHPRSVWRRPEAPRLASPEPDQLEPSGAQGQIAI